MRLFVLISALLISVNVFAETNVPIHEGDKLPNCGSFHPLAMYQFRAHCEDWPIRRGRKFHFLTNNLGLRDRDYSPYAKKGVQRIFLGGPSTLVAPGLTEEEMPTRRYEKHLREKHLKVEVINGGNDGYSNGQSAARTVEYIKAYHPAYFFYLYRSWAKDTMYSRNTHISNGVLSVVDPLYSRSFPDSLRNFILKNGLAPAYHSLRYFTWRALTTYSCMIHLNEVDRAECLLGDTLKSVKYMQNKANEMGSKFALLLFPILSKNRGEIHPDWSIPIAQAIDAITPEISFKPEVLEEVLKRNGITFIELDPASTRFTLPDDFHLNETGADMFAQDLANKTYSLFKGKTH